MPQLPEVRNLNLKVVFLVHFVFISLSSMGYWSATAYLFYNCIFMLFLLWSIYHDQSHEPVQMAIVVNGCSIILDILLLVMGFPSNNSAREKFSAAMAILHLILRPISTIVLIKNLEERSGSTGVLTGILSGGRNETYEDIDSTHIPQPSGHPTGYDFTTAQQI